MERNWEERAYREERSREKARIDVRNEADKGINATIKVIQK